MSIEIKVPALPESIADATVAQWHKKPGDAVQRDEILLELETDKVMLEVPAAQSGILETILKPVGSTVSAQEALGTISPTAAGAAPSAPAAAPAKAPAPTAPAPASTQAATIKSDLSPAVRRLVGEHDLNAQQIQGTGKGGRLTKEDVLAHTSKTQTQAPPAQAAQSVSTNALIGAGERIEKRVPMSRLRARIAERLVAAQHDAAMLTTFNEVNMQPVIDLRNRYKDSFEKSQGVKLGFMSFFVKAVIEALKRFPVVNASIDGEDILYHSYYDMGIAISSPRGLVVPILRDADTLSMAGIEKAIVEYAEKARSGKLTIEEMTGGTFTITNGGIFGSMLSTPIINAPQCAILGMHNIVKRAVVETDAKGNDSIVIRPMMYLALSYDHRLIDGRESVSFLLTIKQLLEDPSRFLLGV
jgi:2-oxoglutarate dehydrogenase E2 component (dihydrolipoamide succinyltransferase)